LNEESADGKFCCQITSRHIFMLLPAHVASV